MDRAQAGGHGASTGELRPVERRAASLGAGAGELGRGRRVGRLARGEGGRGAHDELGRGPQAGGRGRRARSGPGVGRAPACSTPRGGRGQGKGRAATAGARRTPER